MNKKIVIIGIIVLVIVIGIIMVKRSNMNYNNTGTTQQNSFPSTSQSTQSNGMNSTPEPQSKEQLDNQVQKELDQLDQDISNGKKETTSDSEFNIQ